MAKAEKNHIYLIKGLEDLVYKNLKSLIILKRTSSCIDLKNQLILNSWFRNLRIGRSKDIKIYGLLNLRMLFYE